jgi:2,4-dienoyl-CoA reductase-like NADH-dependent reductase (Old Yellow Enzyme family)
MSILWEPCRVGGLELPSRLMRSATFDAMALPGGEASLAQEELFAGLAAGGVGLVVSGICVAHESGRISPVQLAADSDQRIPGLARLARAVHALGGKAAVQLHHGGAESHRFHQGARPALAPSDPPPGASGWRAADQEELAGLVEAFAAAARRVREAGFDAVQVHGAHGYLFSQFLSPLTNRRRDAWGGGLEGRLRLHRETARAVRREAGADFPLWIKLGVADAVAGGLELEEGLAAAAACAEMGYQAIEVSLGLRGDRYSQTEFRTDVDRPGRDAYYRDWCRRAKEACGAPTVLQGGLREPGVCEQALAAGEADLVAMSRPLIREPGLLRRWQGGDRSRARCISCNLCLDEVRQRRPVRCVAAEQARRKEEP